jgi:hypothetical protein
LKAQEGDTLLRNVGNDVHSDGALHLSTPLAQV